MFDAWEIAALAFFGSILVAIIVWQLLAAWANWYLRRHRREFHNIVRIEPSCERAGSQGEFYRRLRTGGVK